MLISETRNVFLLDDSYHIIYYYRMPCDVVNTGFFLIM
jgi:hypothetical protein